MIKRIHFLAVLFALLFGCGRPQPAPPAGPMLRIISLAPNITEMVYLLGLGDKLVGATAYCIWPDEAVAVPRIGGFGQYNFEAIVSLSPDLVLLHRNHESEKARLNDLGIPCLEIRDEHPAEILESLRAIGAACGAEAQAEKLTADIRQQLANVKKPQNPPRVLITFSGGAAEAEPIYAFGADCLHNDLLELAGGRNVVENKLPFSTLSKEAVIRLNPDIIIQLAPRTQAPADPAAAWEAYGSVSAVQQQRVYVLTGSYTCIPGPRFTRILADFEQILERYE